MDAGGVSFQEKERTPSLIQIIASPVALEF